MRDTINVRIAAPSEWLFGRLNCDICGESVEPDMLIVLEQILGQEKKVLTKLCVYCGASINRSLSDCLAKRLLNMHEEDP